MNFFSSPFISRQCGPPVLCSCPNPSYPSCSHTSRCIPLLPEQSDFVSFYSIPSILLQPIPFHLFLFCLIPSQIVRYIFFPIWTLRHLLECQSLIHLKSNIKQSSIGENARLIWYAIITLLLYGKHEKRVCHGWSTREWDCSAVPAVIYELISITGIIANVTYRVGVKVLFYCRRLIYVSFSCQ